MAVTSLYTVIPKNEGLQALKYFFGQRPIKKPSTETLLHLPELNCFSFGDNYYTNKSTVLEWEPLEKVATLTPL